LVLLSLLAGSLGLNLYLGLELRHRPGLASPPGRGLQRGEVVEALEMRDKGGTIRVFNFRGEPTVLYLFRPACPWCKRNLPAVNTLEESVRGRFRFVSVSLDDSGVTEVFQDESARGSTYTLAPKAAAFAKRVPVVPMTVALSKDGVVLETWAGAYAGDVKKSIETYFGTKLASIRAAMAASP